MNSSTGLLLVVLISTVVLTKEGVSSKHHHVQEEVEDESQEAQEEQLGPEGYGGRSFLTPSQAVYGTPQVPPSSQNHALGAAHGHAYGEIHLDLTQFVEELGIREIGTSMNQLNAKVDDVYNVLKNVMQNEMNNNLNPASKIWSSKMDHLAGAVKSLQDGMEVINNYMQERYVRKNIDSKCESKCLEQFSQVLQNAMGEVMQEFKDFKAYLSETMKILLQQTAQNRQTMMNLQSGVSATYNTCSVFSVSKGSETRSSAIAEMIDRGMKKMTSLIVDTMPRSWRLAVREDLMAEALALMKHTSTESAEIKKYLLDLTTKMVRYRDEYLKHLMDQSKQMQVIKKTVTQTTSVVKQAVQGAEDAAIQAQRSLDSNSLCPGTKKK